MYVCYMGYTAMLLIQGEQDQDENESGKRNNRNQRKIPDKSIWTL